MPPYGSSGHLGRVLWYLAATVAFGMAVFNWFNGNDDEMARCLFAQFCCVMLSRGWDD